MFIQKQHDSNNYGIMLFFLIKEIIDVFKIARAAKQNPQKLRTPAGLIRPIAPASPLTIGAAKTAPRLIPIRITDVVGVPTFLGATYATRRKAWGKTQPKKTPVFRSESFRGISMAVPLSGLWLSINTQLIFSGRATKYLSASLMAKPAKVSHDFSIALRHFLSFLL